MDSETGDAIDVDLFSDNPNEGDSSGGDPIATVD
jgi:hypothetical protein